MAVLMTPPQIQFTDDNGDPLAAGLVYFYAAGTATPKDTYTDSGGLTPNANPVVLDSAGRASIYLSGSYKIVIKNSSGTQIGEPQDNVTAFATSTSGTFTDDDFIVQDGTDTTRGFRLQISSVSTGTTRTWTVPNASSTFVGTDATQTLTNKTLTSPTINTPTLAVLDNALSIKDNADSTKIFQIQCSGITTGTTRTMTVPDADFTAVGLTTAQTLTNKTLTSPAINTPTITGGVITGSARFYQFSASMADDTAISFTPVNNAGFLMFGIFGGSTLTRIGLGTFASAGGMASIHEGTAVDIVTAAGALAGTTGVDGQFSAKSDTGPLIYLENRLAATVTATGISFG